MLQFISFHVFRQNLLEWLGLERSISILWKFISLRVIDGGPSLSNTLVVTDFSSCTYSCLTPAPFPPAERRGGRVVYVWPMGSFPCVSASPLERVRRISHLLQSQHLEACLRNKAVEAGTCKACFDYCGSSSTGCIWSALKGSHSYQHCYSLAGRELNHPNAVSVDEVVKN